MSEADIFDEEEDQDVEMTASEVLYKLEEAWINEKFSPELLEGHMDLVDCMMDQLTAMESNLQLAKKGDLKISLHRMEIDRIRFVISSYLRNRLEKIEKYPCYVLEQDSQRKDDETPLMSDAERQFATKFLDAKRNHFSAQAMKHMPTNMKSAENELKGVAPKLDSYVFLKVKERTENVLIEEDTVDAGEEIIDLEKGDQHIVRYKPVSALVSSGAVSLI